MCDAIKGTKVTLLLIFRVLSSLFRLLFRIFIEVKLRVRSIIKRHLMIEDWRKMLHDGR